VQRGSLVALAAALISVVVVASASARPQATTPVTETAASGNVRAELSYLKEVDSGGFTRYSNLRLTITRNGQAVSNTPPRSSPIEGLWPGNAWKAGAKSVHVADLDGDDEPEVSLDLFTGGAHCCRMYWAYRWDGATYVAQEIQTGSSSYTQRDLNRDRRPEWITTDPRFEYLFTSFADSGVPVRIYTYRDGSFVVVTKSYPALVRKDAARWWRIYQRERTAANHDNRGFLAAWAADMYLRGLGAKVWPALNAAYRRGDLTVPRGNGPTGRAYINKLRKKLRELGYSG
jgi:hypothetical protein